MEEPCRNEHRRKDADQSSEQEEVEGKTYSRQRGSIARGTTTRSDTGWTVQLPVGAQIVQEISAAIAEVCGWFAEEMEVGSQGRVQSQQDGSSVRGE